MFRFTIRDVLWLTVVVALTAGWGMDRWRLIEKLQAEAALDWQGAYEMLVEALEERGYTVTWTETDNDQHSMWLLPPRAGSMLKTEYAIPPGQHYTARPISSHRPKWDASEK